MRCPLLTSNWGSIISYPLCIAFSPILQMYGVQLFFFWGSTATYFHWEYEMFFSFPILYTCISEKVDMISVRLPLKMGFPSLIS